MLTILAIGASANRLEAFNVFEVPNYGIARWDAAPRVIDGLERSLDGGLRYSLQGGSYEAFRDLLHWQGTPPSVADLQAAIEQSFAAWEAVDAATGLGTNLHFVADLETPTVSLVQADELRPHDAASRIALNPGAEIDLVVQDRGCASCMLTDTYFYADSPMLTSGVANYPAAIISGVDFLIDDAEGVGRTLEDFRGRLFHEIGHALGLGDGDVPEGHFEVFTRFYDDNYDNTNDATALATLTNSFANVIDPFDPDNSPGLSLYDVCCEAGSPGIDSPGVELFLEQRGDDFTSLDNDAFAGRQFLYPYVPPQPGDFDVDRDVDGKDFLLWQQGGSPDPLSSEDLATWQANYGVASSLASAQTVPEPSGILLVTLYLIAVTCRRRSASRPILCCIQTLKAIL